MGFISDLFRLCPKFIYNWVENYGLAIIFFSVILQNNFVTFFYKATKIYEKISKRYKNKVQKLQVKYRNNPELLNQEVMGLYKKKK